MPLVELISITTSSICRCGIINALLHSSNPLNVLKALSSWKIIALFLKTLINCIGPGKLPLCFPGHHPEYDSDISRELSNSFMTTSRCAYVDPRLRKEPIKKSSFAVDTPK